MAERYLKAWKIDFFCILIILILGTSQCLAASFLADTAVSAGKQTASSGMIFKGKVPLYKGAKVLKEKTMGTNSKADLEVPASPEEIVNFYKQVMSAKDWQPGMAMVKGSMGVLQLKKDRSLITLKATGNGQKSIVTISYTTF